MKKIIIIAGLLLVAFVGALTFFASPSHTESQKKNTVAMNICIAMMKQEKINPAAASKLLIFQQFFRGQTSGISCQTKEDCYDGDCSDPLISCDDAESNEFCGCGFYDSTAECCENRDQCEKTTYWGVTTKKKCKSYCKDL